MTVCSPKELYSALSSTTELPSKLSFQEWLVQEGAITADNLREILRNHPDLRTNHELARFLRLSGACDRAAVDRAYARSLNLPLVQLGQFAISPQALERIPADFARAHDLIPIALVRDKLAVAMANPTNLDTLSLLNFITKQVIEPVYAPLEDIDLAIAQYYSPSDDQEALKDISEPETPTDDTASPQQAERQALEKPTVKLVQNLILDAINRRASDIHIRPEEKSVEVLYRIDGSLVNVRTLPRAMLNPAVARIKILGGMNIAEHRLPQDGRARVRARDRQIDLRISIMPAIHGESVVIRILDTSGGLKTIDDLGFDADDAVRFRHVMHRSSGLYLVTGPTGSGKSTTLYAALQEVVKRGIHVITVEDPVEYHLAGVLQIQTHAAIGYTFARALRNILRHDPDAIMVGEIRDEETARIAVESALTGHLVLSTLHTNSAAATVTRLLEIGIPAYLLRSTLVGVLAQRLMRRNCTHCLAPEPIDEHVRSLLGLQPNEPFWKGQGCDQCHGTGYRGRMAVYEQLLLSPALRDLINPGVSASDIESLAEREGMTPLTQRALGLARQKITSLEEVYRVRLE